MVAAGERDGRRGGLLVGAGRSGVVLTLAVGGSGVTAQCRPGDRDVAHLTALLGSLAPGEQVRLCSEMEEAIRQQHRSQRGLVAASGMPSLTRALSRAAAPIEPRAWLQAQCPQVYAEVEAVARVLTRRADTGQRPRPPAPLVLTASPPRRRKAVVEKVPDTDSPEVAWPAFFRRFATADRARLDALLERLSGCAAPQVCPGPAAHASKLTHPRGRLRLDIDI